MGKKIVCLSLSLLLLLFVVVPLAKAGKVEDLEKRIEALERQLKAERGSITGFRPMKAEWLEIGGELEYEFIDTEHESDSATFGETTNSDDARFDLDKVDLNIKATISEDIYLKGTLEGNESKITVHSWQAHFGGLPGDSWFKVGLLSRSAKGIDAFNKKTEAYSLNGTSFWRSHEQGVMLGGEYANLAWRLSYGDGLDLAEKQPAEDDSYEILYDSALGASGKHEVGVALRYRFDLTELGALDLTGFGYWDKLTAGEKAGTQANIQTAIGGSDSQRRVGGRLTWKVGDALLAYERMEANDGSLERTGWFAQASYKFQLASPLFAGKYVTAIEPLVRYGELDLDKVTRVTTQAQTWDREKTAIGFLFDIYKNVKVKAEYYINDEDTGGSEPDNDELLVQLEIKF